MNKIKLKYASGNVLDENVHKIGIIALGSHRENHGSALPIDTDSKIAANVALSVATKTGVTFLGIFYAATEYDYVKHGHHLKQDELIYQQMIPQLINARDSLDISKVIIVNGHGGNNLIIDEIEKIAEETKLEIIFNNSIIENEGPHACTGDPQSTVTTKPISSFFALSTNLLLMPYPSTKRSGSIVTTLEKPIVFSTLCIIAVAVTPSTS